MPLQRPRIKPNNRNRKNSRSAGDGGLGDGLTLLGGGQAVLGQRTCAPGQRGPSAQLEGLGMPGGGTGRAEAASGHPASSPSPGRLGPCWHSPRAARPHLLQVCVCLWICLYECVSVCVYTSICLSLCVSLCVYVSMSVSVYMYVSVCAHVCV